MFKKIVDPSINELLTMPNSKQDTIITLYNNCVTCFDNLQHISNERSDLLCMAVIGGAHSSRTLFTNSDETIMTFKRIVAVNGINVVATNADLVDRALIIELQRIPEEERKTEMQIWEEFDQDRSRILGAIFNTVSSAIDLVKEVRLDKVGRMADFTYYGYAIAEVLKLGGDKFVDAYLKNKSRANDETLNSNPVGAALLKLIEKEGGFEGSMTALLKKLEEIAKEEVLDTTSRIWVKDPTSLSKRLKEIKSNPEQKGIFYDVRNIGAYKKIEVISTRYQQKKDKDIDIK